MLIISQKQAGQRWDVITPALREALFSDVNADFVWNLCQAEHLTEEKSYQVAEISGYVLLGFLHPEDLADELVSAMGLPTPLAKTLSDKINSRIFTPLRADIDKVYSPLSRIGHIPTGVPQNIVPSSTQTTPKLTILSDVGWSKMSPTAPKEKVPVPEPPKPITPASVPAPVMLHEDTTFKAAEKNAGFTLTKPQSGAEMSFGKSPAQTPIRPAVLEFGSSAGGANKPAPKPSVPEFKSAPITAPTASGGSRTISQITAPTASPMPPPSPVSAVPKPPAPPTPPTSVTPAAPKPLVIKNFTGGSIPTPPPVPRPPQTSATPQMPIPQPPQPPKPPASPFESIPKPPAPPTPPQNSKAIVKDFLS